MCKRTVSEKMVYVSVSKRYFYALPDSPIYVILLMYGSYGNHSGSGFF